MPSLAPTRASTASLVLALAATAPLQAQSSNPSLQESGPVIQSTGISVVVDAPTFKVPAGHVFKAVFVIDAGNGDSDRPNEQVMTLARFYNLHARNGVPATRVRTAAVVHGSGWIALLSDSAHAARFGGRPNPSRRMVEELQAQGAQLVLCGQTAGIRGVRREELLPGVQLAISAMSALNVLQAVGYRYNPW